MLGAFTIGAHLAFTLAFEPEWLPAVVVGKTVAGLLSIPVALFLYKRFGGAVSEPQNTENERETAPAAE